ncbi:MBL fold metallo-hydrolase [Cohnella nanjingensis]|uniref:MBL fold metallo-hydrolase n=1 Tax=Cohnella nanjingensis TaxID=1387779 RepID=A0A7X0RQ93_9BACL|nr:MBL fold metallo-hydrolase [Cohnella nanjingensis]MBB6671673.1 MBL fold metallo-hydrolase [Cohnella nanjingensis]
MKLRLIRNATLWIEYGGLRIVVDPMLSDAGANPPIQNSPNARNNPLVPLPVPAGELAAADLLIVTHRHPDHWDAAAAAFFSRDLRLLCQPEDEEALRGQGFANATPVPDTLTVDGVTATRTGGRHGTGAIGERMGPVSGFVLRAAGEPTLYIAGDTIWCPEVEAALAAHRPDWTVVNAGGARFLEGDPITMTPEDVIAVSRTDPAMQVVAVHMEAINHCLVTRDDLRAALIAADLSERVRLPKDGDWI